MRASCPPACQPPAGGTPHLPLCPAAPDCPPRRPPTACRPPAAIKFLTYEQLSRKISHYLIDNGGDGQLTPLLRLTAGAGARTRCHDSCGRTAACVAAAELEAAELHPLHAGRAATLDLRGWATGHRLPVSATALLQARALWACRPPTHWTWCGGASRCRRRGRGSSTEASCTPPAASSGGGGWADGWARRGAYGGGNWGMGDDGLSSSSAVAAALRLVSPPS